MTRRATMREKAEGRFILSTPQFLQGCVGPWGRRARTRGSAVDTPPRPEHREQRSPSRRPGKRLRLASSPNTRLGHSGSSGANQSRAAARGRLAPTVYWGGRPAGRRTVRLDPAPPRGPSGCRDTSSRGAPLRTLDTHLPAAKFQAPRPGTTRPLQTYLCRVAGRAQVTNLSEQLAQRSGAGPKAPAARTSQGSGGGRGPARPLSAGHAHPWRWGFWRACPEPPGTPPTRVPQLPAARSTPAARQTRGCSGQNGL